MTEDITGAWDPVVTGKWVSQPPQTEGLLQENGCHNPPKGGRPRQWFPDRCYGCHEPIADDASIWFITYVGRGSDCVYHLECGKQYIRDPLLGLQRVRFIRHRCGACGREMILRDSSPRRYCSDACRQAAYRRRARDEEPMF